MVRFGYTQLSATTKEELHSCMAQVQEITNGKIIATLPNRPKITAKIRLCKIVTLYSEDKKRHVRTKEVRLPKGYTEVYTCLEDEKLVRIEHYKEEERTLYKELKCSTLEDAINAFERKSESIYDCGLYD